MMVELALESNSTPRNQTRQFPLAVGASIA
jgi:hypothetical protein